ncbi:hypothetical protein F2Q69_00030322 [Brassica cretica]|uniref:Uncharacterized protein n=1 Tax=Brassica cretica TaxID=69181 RepID=A0A8S9SAM3_BRACR|nr:hypothetical protein F2Q69_00030322 [Brassica cretica]
MEDLADKELRCGRKRKDDWERSDSTTSENPQMTIANTMPESTGHFPKHKHMPAPLTKPASEHRELRSTLDSFGATVSHQDA